MIAKGATLRIERILLCRLFVTETTSVFPEKYAIYFDLLTKHPEMDVDPLIVTPAEGCPDIYYISNGKHRFCASIMAGREDALCIVVDNKEQA